MTTDSVTRSMVPTLVSTLVILQLVLLSFFAFRSYFTAPDLLWLNYDHHTESRAEAIRVPRIVSYEAVAPSTNVHKFLDNGEVTVGVEAPKHPVLEILNAANAEWESIVNEYQGDQERAILHYRYRRSGRNQPKSGLANADFPIHHPLHLFAPISSSLLKLRQRETEILQDTFTLTLRSGVPRIIYANLSQSISKEYLAERAEQLLTAIKPFAHDLPNLQATFNLLPHPRHPIHFEAIDALTALAVDERLPPSSFKFLSQVESTGSSLPQIRRIHEKDLAMLEKIMTRREHWNWEDGCRTQPDIDEFEDEHQTSDSSSSIRLVAFPKLRSDPCMDWTLKELHPFYKTFESKFHTRLSPVVSDTAAPWASDILIPPLDLFSSQDNEKSVNTTSWDKKTTGLFWRGPLPAEETHPAARLYRFFNMAARENKQSLILPYEHQGLSIDYKWLKDVFTYDVQAGSYQDAREQETSWKFLVDLGEGIRMHERMASGGLVFRPLLLGDWFSERSIPWVHYIPIQPDLSDLPSLVAFFQRHDGLARSIATAGQAWARERLNSERARESLQEVLEGFAALDSQR